MEDQRSQLTHATHALPYVLPTGVYYVRVSGLSEGAKGAQPLDPV